MSSPRPLAMSPGRMPGPASRTLLFLLLGMLAAPAPSSAQDEELSRIETLIAASRLTEARAALLRWQQTPARAEPAQDAHALLLRARLAPRADSAEALYLEVALGYPSTAVAPEALLRLGQAALAGGDAQRAAGYLERLTRDYPSATQRTAGQIWLARALRVRRRANEACALLDVASRSVADASLRPLLDSERAACSAPAPTAVAVADAPAKATHAVQVGAFRDENTARALARRLRERGFDARVVFTGGTLALVRVGGFNGTTAAVPALRRIRALHRDAVIVDDVARERASR